LKLHLKDKGTGKENKITISGSSGLSDDEINKMVKEAELNKEADEKKRQIVDAKNQAEAMLHSTKKTLEENKGVVSADEEKKIVDEAAKLEEMLKDETVTKEKLDEQTKKLTEASTKLAEMVAKKQTAQAQGEAPKQEKKKKKDDDVIDAEVE